MSQVQGDKDSSQREKGNVYFPECIIWLGKVSDEALPDLSANFADFPLDATIKYLTHHGIDPQYPPQNMIQDPDVGKESQDSRSETQFKEQEDTDDVQDSARRTRSTTSNTDRRKEDDPWHFYNHDDEHTYLASLATGHYQARPPPKEIDVIVGFLHRCHRAGTSAMLVG